MQFQYQRATDFDRAWLNFELDLPLDPCPDGSVNPFYVERPGDAAGQLEESLRAPFYQPPKFFFSGHRGCGKSTELRRLAANPEILKTYYPIHFTIRDEADINNLDFKDILLAIGGRLYREYTGRGNKLSRQVEETLNRWRGTMQQEVIHSNRLREVEVDGGLFSFFAQAGLKIKLEPATRTTLRQVIERDITGLIDVIDELACAIQTQEKRVPLLLIDDLDKPDLHTAQEIFYAHRETMLQPNCAIVYTVSSPLFYSPEFEAIRDRALFLPNIKLHARGQTRADRTGYKTMRDFVAKRMDLALIGPQALKHAVKTSGGVLRELSRVMRFALRHGRKNGKIQLEHVRLAEAEIRGEYRRILTGEQRATLQKVYRTNQYDEPEKIAPLLQILAALEYADDEPWCDVHPALIPLLQEDGHIQNEPPAPTAPQTESAPQAD
jgi:hypothetical protein